MEKSKNVSELSKETDYDQTTISHNLKRLKTCGFVTIKRDGKLKIYSLNKETIKPLLKLMNMHINKYCKKICQCNDKERKVVEKMEKIKIEVVSAPGCSKITSESNKQLISKRN